MNGNAMHVDGTSASAPVIAAIMTLFNDVRLRAGQPPLGMVAPLLYKLFERSRHTFSDVVVGNNGATHEKPCPSGYIAAVGWDAATGLGLPGFSEIVPYLTQWRGPPAMGQAIELAGLPQQLEGEHR